MSRRSKPSRKARHKHKTHSQKVWDFDLKITVEVINRSATAYYPGPDYTGSK